MEILLKFLGFIIILGGLYLIFILLCFLFRTLKVRKISNGINVKYVVERSFLGIMAEYLYYEDNYTTSLDEAQKCNTIEDALYLIFLMRGGTKYKKIK